MDHSDGPSTRLYWHTSDVLYISNLIFHNITIVSKHSIIIMYQSKIKTLRSADMSEQDLTVHDEQAIIERIVYKGEKVIDVALKFGIRC